SGHINVVHSDDSASHYSLSQILIEETDVSDAACTIDLVGNGGGVPRFVVGDSRLEFRRAPAPGHVAPNGICVDGFGGTWQVDLFRNRVRSDNGSLLRAISVGGTAAGTVTLDGNQVFGSGFISGLLVSINTGALANQAYIQNNTVVGQRVGPSSGEFGMR